MGEKYLNSGFVCFYDIFLLEFFFFKSCINFFLFKEKITNIDVGPQSRTSKFKFLIGLVMLNIQQVWPKINPDLHPSYDSNLCNITHAVHFINLHIYCRFLLCLFVAGSDFTSFERMYHPPFTISFKNIHRMTFFDISG